MSDFYGTSGDDSFYGTDNDDRFWGRAGDDTFKGKDGNDLIFGEAGDDTLKGEDDDDRIHGGAGNDKLYGGDDNDTLQGGAGSDVLKGGADNDTLIYDATLNGASDHDFYDGGYGSDALVLRLTSAQFNAAAVQADIAAFAAMGGSGDAFTFGAFNLSVDNIGALAVQFVSGPPPAAKNDVLGASEDAPRTFDPLSNDKPAGALAIDGVDGSNLLGRVVDNGDGTLTYDPNGAFEHLRAGESVTETFDYTVTDAFGQTDGATVTVTVNGVNDAPEAPADPVELPASSEGVPRGVFYSHLMRELTDAEGDRLHFVEVVESNVAYGVNRSGIVFHPDGNDDGEVRFTARFADGNGGTVDVEAFFDLLPVNDAPEGPATVALAPGREDVDRTVTVAELLNGMTDADGDALAVTDLSVSAGRILDNEDGTFTYDGPRDMHGEVVFSYRVTDGTVSVAREATLSLAPVNDAPELVVSYDSFETVRHNGMDHTRATVTFTATDADGDPVTLSLAPGGAPAYGDVAVRASGLSSAFDAASGELTILYSDDMRADVLFNVRATDASGAFTDADGWIVRGDTVDLAAGDVRIDARRPEFLHGLETGERLVGGGGRDFIWGHGGDDIVIDGALGGELFGGAGNDRVFGGAGDDGIYGGTGADRLFGQTGDDRMFGDDGHDRLRGWTGEDLMVGGAGDDLLAGEADDDALYGDAGRDKLCGGMGNDELWGGSGNDSLFGGLGDDLLAGENGADRLEGGAGRDTFRISGDEGYRGRDVIVDYKAGVDTVLLDVTRPAGEVVPLTRSEVLATESFEGGRYVYAFGDTTFAVNAQLQVGDIEIV